MASVCIPRAASSSPANSTLISLQLSMPSNTTTVGAGPAAPGAFMKSAGSVVPSYGTSRNSTFGWRRRRPAC